MAGTTCPACLAPIPQSAIMPLGNAICPNCGKRLILNPPVRIGALVVSAITSYQTLARTGLRENVFFLFWLPLLVFTHIALIRMLSRVFRLPLAVLAEPYEHFSMYSTPEEQTPEEARLKRLADSIKDKSGID